MQTAELAPPSHAEMQETRINEFPHFGIPGFEKLPAETQRTFLLVPPSHLDAARPTIEATNTKTQAVNREAQTNDAIETFRRAEAGDPKAREELLDLRKELLNEDPDPDEILQTILENESGNPLAQDTVLEVMLTDEEAESHQKVLDLFKEFRGELPSVDSILKPEQQIELFEQITQGHGSYDDRMLFAHKAMTELTASGNRGLFKGLQDLHILKNGEILKNGVDELRDLTDKSDAA